MMEKATSSNCGWKHWAFYFSVFMRDHSDNDESISSFNISYVCPTNRTIIIAYCNDVKGKYRILSFWHPSVPKKFHEEANYRN